MQHHILINICAIFGIATAVIIIGMFLKFRFIIASYYGCFTESRCVQLCGTQLRKVEKFIRREFSLALLKTETTKLIYPRGWRHVRPAFTETA